MKKSKTPTNNKLLFVSSAIQQPRHQRRAHILSSQFHITLLYNVRDSYKKNIKQLNLKTIFLGNISRKKGFISYISSRLISNFKLLIYFLFYQRHSALYLTAPDQALVAIIACRSFFIEYGDIQSLSNNSKLSRLLDKIICKYAKGIIVTSPAYLTDYFFKFNELRAKFCVAENKVPESVANMVKSKEKPSKLTANSEDDKIRLGLIGALSRVDIYSIYQEIVSENIDYTLHVFGDGDLGALSTGNERVFLHGPFSNPDDLISIYDSIDIVLINYDYDDANVQLALPNKLYEAMLFKKPIVCSKHTYLAEVVEAKNIGVASLLNKADIAHAIQLCASTNYSTIWRTIPHNDYISDNKHICEFITEQLG